MSDEVKLPTEDELKRLTRRALVAYAVRASRRVEPLYRSDNAAHENAVRDANRSALVFVGATGADAGGAAAAADDAARATADVRFDFGARADADAADFGARAANAAAVAAVDAAANAANAAANGVNAAANAVNAAKAAANAARYVAAGVAGVADAACRADYDELLAFVARSGDAAGELGTPFNVDEELGPLWPQGEPQWYRAASGKQEETANDDEGSLPSEDDLKRLTRRALVAYAVRASLRVEPLYHSDNPADEEAVRDTNQSAVDFVRATRAGADAAGVADAAADAIAKSIYADIPQDKATEAAARTRNAAQAAVYAAQAAGESAANAVFYAAQATAYAAEAAADAGNIVGECRSDYKRLLEISGDAAGELGEPFDLEMELGPLWSNGEPDWFSADPSDEQIFPEIEPLEFLLEPGSATREEIRDLFYEMSKLYRMMGGSGINFSVIDAYAFDDAEVTA